MKLVTKIIMSGLLCIYLMMQRSRNLFTKLKYRALFSINYETSELYQSKLHMELSQPSVRGCMS